MTGNYWRVLHHKFYRIIDYADDKKVYEDKAEIFSFMFTNNDFLKKRIEKHDTVRHRSPE